MQRSNSAAYQAGWDICIKPYRAISNPYPKFSDDSRDFLYGYKDRRVYNMMQSIFTPNVVEPKTNYAFT
jgi:hypothetical protein